MRQAVTCKQVHSGRAQKCVHNEVGAKIIQIKVDLSMQGENYQVRTNRGKVVLTPRELDCLYYALIGFTAKVTARLLNISHRTVETHIENIKNKTGCFSRLEIINTIKHQVCHA